jgi:predicted amidohydrolase YtcJ
MPTIDRLFVNGRVWTGDPGPARAEALAVSGETIVAVGSTAQMRAIAPSGVAIVDFEGRCVVPGFIDAHWHLLPNSRATFFMADGLAEFQQRLQRLRQAHPSGDWIVDSGWAYTDFPDGLPHRRWIDAVVGDRPVWLTGRDGHMALGNTLALQALGIDDGSGPSAVRDARGALTGEVRGMGELEHLKAQLPAPTPAEVDLLLREVQGEANAFGVTSVHNLDENFGEDLTSLQKARREGWLTLRVQQSQRLLAQPDAQRLALLESRRSSTEGDTMFRFGGLKGWLDGTIDARTAHMREALTDGSQGLAYWDTAELAATVAQMDRLGWQVMLHATGDAAIGQAIGAYEHAARVNGQRDSRHRIEHFDIPDASDLERCARGGIVASVQPNFAYPDDTVLDNYSALLGPERTHRAQPYRSIDAAGVRQCFSSDHPVSSMDVLRSMQTALTRARRHRSDTAPWTPHERIGIEAALNHFTADAAWAGFDENRKGRLAAGLLADMAVLSDDIVGDPDRLGDAQVLMTVLGGRVVYQTTRAAAAVRARATSPMRMARADCPACRSASLDPQLLTRRAGHGAGNSGRWRRRA